MTCVFFVSKFVCVESLVTAVVDMYPETFRRGYRRELLILGMSIVSFLIGLIMCMEVSCSSHVHVPHPLSGHTKLPGKMVLNRKCWLSSYYLFLKCFFYFCLHPSIVYIKSSQIHCFKYALLFITLTYCLCQTLPILTFDSSSRKKP